MVGVFKIKSQRISTFRKELLLARLAQDAERYTLSLRRNQQGDIPNQ
jgi:hypothetical protein